jgi:hypothetical protein
LVGVGGARWEEQGKGRRRCGRWARVGPVATTQIAPTILTLLGLDPHALQALQIECTQALPLHCWTAISLPTLRADRR